MQFGHKCESLAADYAAHVKGWRVIARNVYSRYGELDLVCHDGRAWRFIEVKGRRGDRFGSGPELVTQAKFQRLIKCISGWMQKEGWGPWHLELWCVSEKGHFECWPLQESN